jgi:NAD(P)-dependent dehydrogenase (short-subunit alcohol dehydrogenase family)
MQRLREGYRALVIGASGAIGKAFCDALRDDRRCAEVVAVSRVSPQPWDLRDEASMAALSNAVTGPFHLVVDATGALTLAGRGPEKRLAEVDTGGLAASLHVNAIGPVLLLRHIGPLLARGERAVWAKLSARVGSIEDNRKGGWYSYRMAKAALNQGLQTAAIELARQRPELIVAALQPGTVRSPLSRPVVGDVGALPADAVRNMLMAIDGLDATGRAHFVDQAGQSIPW